MRESYPSGIEFESKLGRHGFPSSLVILTLGFKRGRDNGVDYIHKHNFPLAVPDATQSLVGWN